MHHVTTALEEQPLLRAVTAAGDAALAVEVLELRARKEQLGGRWRVVR